MDWALGVTAPNAEHRVQRALDYFSIPNRIFWRTVKTARRGQLIERFVPHFSRYVFIPAQHCFRAYHLRDYTHVIALFRSQIGDDADDENEDGGKLILCRRGDVESLEKDATCIGGRWVLPPLEIPARFKSGDRIRIIGASSTSGQCGIFDRMLDNGRARVMLPWLGGMAMTTIDECELELDVPSVKPDRRKRGGRRRRKRYSKS